MFDDLENSLAELKNLPAMRGRTTDADDQFLTALLELSAGVDPDNITRYRIYYVAARWLQQPGSIHVLEQAERGVRFTGLAVPIASLLGLQASTDAALNLSVPEGFESEPDLNVKRHVIFGSQTISLQVMP